MSTTSADLLKVDLMDEALFDDGPPHELFAQMRAEAPVLKTTAAEGGDFWSVTKAEDIAAISKNTDVFSSEKAGIFIREGMPMPLDVLNQVILGMDPAAARQVPRDRPEGVHAANRSRAQEEQIRGRITNLIDGFCEHGECDLVQALSIELPLQVICELLGVPSGRPPSAVRLDPPDRAVGRRSDRLWRRGARPDRSLPRRQDRPSVAPTRATRIDDLTTALIAGRGRRGAAQRFRDRGDVRSADVRRQRHDPEHPLGRHDRADREPRPASEADRGPGADRRRRSRRSSAGRRR